MQGRTIALAPTRLKTSRARATKELTKRGGSGGNRYTARKVVGNDISTLDDYGISRDLAARATGELAKHGAEKGGRGNQHRDGKLRGRQLSKLDDYGHQRASAGAGSKELAKRGRDGSNQYESKSERRAPLLADYGIDKHLAARGEQGPEQAGAAQGQSVHEWNCRGQRRFQTGPLRHQP